MGISSQEPKDRSAGQLPDSATGNNRASEEARELWRRFAEASSPHAFYESWLSLQCRMLKRVRCALLLLGAPDTGPFTPAAVFPSHSYDVTHLAATAERSLKERRGLVATPSGNGDSDVRYIAYPLDVSKKIHGVVVLETEGLSEIEVQAAMRQLHWGAAWVELMLRRAEAPQFKETNERLRTVLNAVAAAVEHERFQAAAMEFVTGLATVLACDRASIGFVERQSARVAALSHSAEFDKKTNLLKAIESAMDEAIDQQAMVLYPAASDGVPLVTQAHQNLADENPGTVLCTVPLGHDGKPFGAVTIERQAAKPIDTSTIELLKTITALAGPILDSKRKEERPIATKVAEVCVNRLGEFVGPGHLALKMTAAILVMVALFVTIVPGVHRVKAPIVLEGMVQRAVSAPFHGYVVEAPARPGDVVRQGALLCRLDERELTLERLKWSTQREQFLKQHSEAMAKHDRAQAVINEAKIDQAEAEVALLDEQLSRAKITAPFEGIVTSGDFNQSLGTAVERGQVLYEIAPLRGYRVIVQVDERDIGWVAIGQRGDLVLPSVPGVSFPMTVRRITPISTAKDGRNYFRVEAELQKTSERLRPGMEGIGKISSGRASLIWIWTHEIIEWIRLKLWSWWP